MSKKKTYTAEYFINKFEAIPEDKWTTGELSDGKGCHCALGHCGMKRYEEKTEEAKILAHLLVPVYSAYFRVGPRPGIHNVYGLNDDRTDLGDHPKERIINALTLAASGALKDVQ